ncbi:MAG: helicase [Candidatus Electrothrix sp. AW3_4]|nr:helicase [Candidatus Electrothrix gigas]
MSFNRILEKYRRIAFSERNKGDRFERLMQAYLQTDPKYADSLEKVWLWKDFPGREDLGGSDTGIDLVARTCTGDYWAVQCKCFQESARIDKPAVDSFLATSGRTFGNEQGETAAFAQRLWISTTNKWSSKATQAISNQQPQVTRINLNNLVEAPVDWEQLDKGISGEQARLCQRDLMPHQREALEAAEVYFKSNSRGRLIMACGTGKTFTSLRIAENETSGKGPVLFLVPSIALLGQTLREWTAFSSVPLHPVCICSDPAVSRKKTRNEDQDRFSVVDLALPASTNVKSILRQFQRIREQNRPGMTVVFSTYQSIEVIAQAQQELIKAGDDFGRFGLIICDEAHRTTGVSMSKEDESAFIRVHDNEFLQADKRLYMTATPRLYTDDAKSRAAKENAVLCSMDDPELYGEEIYRIGFGRAVEQGLLTDYKVLILTLNDGDIPPAIQKMISDEDHEINTDDASKLIGCINALSKQIIGDEGSIKANDPEPMRRAVAFCPRIKESKKITDIFNESSEVYINDLPAARKERMVSVASRHIDGTMSAPERDELLSWLKAETEEKECRILTNVRCLSEGVDVPSLDAVMFLSARNSQVDVVQSVGRVMRRAEGKQYGYIIIPVVVPSFMEADKALDDNERYRVVWTVLNALRAHDDRFNATINKIDLNRKKPDNIMVGRPDYPLDDGGASLSTAESGGEYATGTGRYEQLKLQFEELQGVIYARMVKKVGSRTYWEQWAKSVGRIAERQVDRINRLRAGDRSHEKAFADFLAGLRNNINPSISEQEAVEMLSQHIITKPVFEALFEGYSFVSSNPVSVGMQSMLDLLEAQAIEKDTISLKKFYESVQRRASGIDNAEGKQRIIIELYDKFFKTAFPKMVERLGIVYTPVEVVDFIIHSVDDVLKKEFKRSLADENVHILDPFTGTGTFITRLLQSGLIDRDNLPRKYRHELHANEILLLAYYIAAVNIENAYHDAAGNEEYIPFDGICLTDTFQLGESDGRDKLFSEMLLRNSERVEEQKKAPLRVIMGNPPYSVGQKSANDNAQNQEYKQLNRRIAETYAAATTATNKNSLYDSYIKAFRWSTDRLDPEHGGIIAFVSNGAWLDGNSADGFRQCLEKEFSAVYLFNLRGNQRTSGELSRKEGGKIFGSGSRTPVSVTLLVKNPEVKREKAVIHYHDIGDYLSREEKLKIIRSFQSVGSSSMQWRIIQPNEQGDWINQRNDAFVHFISMGDKKNKKNQATFFVPFYSNGVKTNRDIWVYNYSRKNLSENTAQSINFFNEQVIAFHNQLKKTGDLKVENFIDSDHKKISWSRALRKDVSQNKRYHHEKSNITDALYRPFCKQRLYFSREIVNDVALIPKLFPTPELHNLVIGVPGIGVTKDFSCIISDTLPDLELIGKSQCFPLYWYEQRQEKQLGLFDTGNNSKYIRRDGISDFIFKRAKKQYGKSVTKEDIFYYVYGILHSPEYRVAFANDLKKMLPRLPLLDKVADFWAFSNAGRALADLHINYETVPPYDGVTVTGADSGFFRVEKMRFPKKDGIVRGKKKKVNDTSTIHLNSKITLSDIPEKAYHYVVNGKSAVEWIMERYQVKTDKKSGITNDPNNWAEEVGNPRYILDVLLSVINVSVQTVDIVDGLPTVDFL